MNQAGDPPAPPRQAEASCLPDMHSEQNPQHKHDTLREQDRLCDQDRLSEQLRQPLRYRSLIVMGVAGSGKSSLAAMLAAKLGWDLLEGDDFHSPEGKQMMAAGQPLCPQLREQWVDRICARLAQQQAQQRCAVLSYSGLIASQRARIRAAAWQPLFVCLDGDPAILLARLEARTDHFMPPSMLQSQLATMQAPTASEAVMRLDLALPLDEAAAQVRQWLQFAC